MTAHEEEATAIIYSDIQTSDHFYNHLKSSLKKKREEQCIYIF